MYAHLPSLSLIGGGYKSYFAQGITNQKEETGNIKRGDANKEKQASFKVGLLSYFGSVCLIKFLSA